MSRHTEFPPKYRMVDFSNDDLVLKTSCNNMNNFDVSVGEITKCFSRVYVRFDSHTLGQFRRLETRDSCFSELLLKRRNKSKNHIHDDSTRGNKSKNLQ